MRLTFRMASEIVESAFLPLSCHCSNDFSSARIRIYDASSGESRLLIAGIQMSGLGTTRSVGKLIGEIRNELEMVNSHTPRPIEHRSVRIQTQRL